MALSDVSLQPSCSGLTDLFFDDDESLATIYECRTVCFTCPRFERCAEASINNYPSLKEGVFAGMPGSTRRAVFDGSHEFVDWRSTWDPARHVVEGLAPLDVREPCLHHQRLKFDVEGNQVCVSCGARVRLIARR